MPELAEVEFYRKRWHEAAINRRIVAILSHGGKRIFRSAPAALLKKTLAGATLLHSEAAAKQMLFQFSGDCWLGIHLGMSGELFAATAGYTPGKHDHLVLITNQHALVFRDPRMFGKIEFAQTSAPPAWWTRIAPSILSPAFTSAAVADFLQRRAKAPIKAVLLMQERFPGIGNWMADEILWRAGIHPARRAGSLDATEIKTLSRECRTVCRLALRHIAGHGGSLPPALNANIPDSWLFNHRWENGGRCPKTGATLMREEIGGRTTCWSPARQKLKRSP